nr:hypothetical protein OG513_39700 [Streptomyces sp. NBC_00998]
MRRTPPHHLLVWLAGQLLHSPTLRACVPSVVGPAERAAYAGQLRKEVSEAPHPHVVAELAASLDARDPGRPAPSLPYTGDAPDARDLILALTTARAASRPPTEPWCCPPPDTYGSSTHASGPHWRP